MNKELEVKLKKSIELHDEFRQKFPDLYKDVVNGAGPAKYGHLIRDEWFYGFSTTRAADVHDYLYSYFCDTNKNEDAIFSRKDADDIFLELMKQDLELHSKFSKVLNTPIIYVFWSSVRLFGRLFWKK